MEIVLASAGKTTQVKAIFFPAKQKTFLNWYIFPFVNMKYQLPNEKDSQQAANHIVAKPSHAKLYP